MSYETLHLLRDYAAKVERGENLTPAERTIAIFSVADAWARVRRARAAGCSVRLSPYVEKLRQVVGGSRAAGGV